MARLLLVSTISRFPRDFLLPYASHFTTLGWQVDALCQGTTEYAECQQAFHRMWEIPWSRNPLHPRNFLEAPQTVRALALQEAYDIIHVHTPVAAFITRYALHALPSPRRFALIYTVHGFHFHPAGHPVTNGVFWGMEKFAGNWTDHLVVINHHDYDVAHRHHFVPPERLHFMPGIGIDFSRYTPAAVPADEIAACRQELHLAPGQPLLVMVAEMTPGKRHKDALLAFTRVRVPIAHLAFAGDGPLRPELETLARRLGIASRVHFLGWRRDIPALMRAATATVLPSEREGLPRVVLESLCLGVPVIGTIIRGTQDLLADGCGVLVPLGSLDEMARGIEWTINHPRAASNMAVRGQTRLQAYDLRHLVQLHESLYTRVLVQAPPPQSPRTVLPGPATDAAIDGLAYEGT